MRLSTFTTYSGVSIAIVCLLSLAFYRGANLEDIAAFAPPTNPESPPNLPKASIDDKLSPSRTWTHIIWQTAKYPSENQTDNFREMSRTWAGLNPLYRHEMITHERMVGYVADNFHEMEPAFEDLYLGTADYMLRTDVIRYLVLLQDGGVYNDLDVSCLQPIDTWIPEQFKDRAGVVVGVEIDNFMGPYGHDVPGMSVFQIAAWTLMAKPDQPFIRFVVDSLVQKMSNVSPDAQATLTQDEVLRLTGPTAMTTDFLAYTSKITGTNVTRSNFTNITEPVMMGEILVLPIWAFGAGHQVERTGFEKDDGKALVHHHFADSWRADHKASNG